MGKNITNSANISMLESSIVFDLHEGKIKVDLLKSSWIGAGATNVSGAKIKVENLTTGFTIKDYANAYDIVPPMTSVFEMSMPKTGKIYQYGDYRVSVTLFDGALQHELVKEANVCGPKGSNITNAGKIKSEIKADCNAGKALVYQEQPPAYQGLLSQSVDFDYDFYYPSSSGVSPAPINYIPFEVQVFQGENELRGNTIATYEIDEEVFVRVPYDGTRVKNVRCQFSLCDAFRKVEMLIQRLQTCDTNEAESVRADLDSAFKLIVLVQLGQDAGEDVSDYIEDLEQLVGCSCDCDNPAIIGAVPAGSVIIEGCNVQKTQNGLTTFYNIDNKTYSVAIVGGNKAYFQVATADGNCSKAFNITLDVSALITEIHSIYTSNSTLWNAFLALLNNVWNDVDPKCLTTTATWDGLSWKDKTQLMVDKICVALSNAGSGTGDPVSPTGPTITLNCGGAIISGNFISGTPSGGTITVPVTISGSGTIAGTIAGAGFTGTLQTTGVTAATTQLVFTLVYDGSGISGNRQVTVAFTGTANNPSCAVGVTVNAVSQCSAPLNISVSTNAGGNTIVFSAATFPPPNYRVERRLASAADVPGSYTVIGTPTYNSGTNKYEITDPIGQPSSPVPNTVYYYKAISLCNDGARPFVGTNYANMTCPNPTLTNTIDTINFSFPHLGGEVNQYEVALWNVTETVQIVPPQIFNAPFGGTISGSLGGALASATSYKVVITAKITGASYVKVCKFDVQTLATTTFSGTVQIINTSGSTVILNAGEGWAVPGTIPGGNTQSVMVNTPNNIPNTFRLWNNATGVPFNFADIDINDLVVAGGTASRDSGQIVITPDTPGSNVVLSGDIIIGAIE